MCVLVDMETASSLASHLSVAKANEKEKKGKADANGKEESLIHPRPGFPQITPFVFQSSDAFLPDVRVVGDTSSELAADCGLAFRQPAAPAGADEEHRAAMRTLDGDIALPFVSIVSAYYASIADDEELRGCSIRYVEDPYSALCFIAEKIDMFLCPVKEEEEEKERERD